MKRSLYPKPNAFTTKGSYIGKVNGIDISKDVVLDNTKPDKDVIHVMLPKNTVIQAGRSGKQKWTGICRINEVYFATGINVFRFNGINVFRFNGINVFRQIMVVAVTIMSLHISVYSSSISFVSLLVVATFVIIATVILYSNSPAFGQTNSGNGTQLWVDRENNVKVQFTYLPQTPIIDTPTQLKFNIQNSQTGTPLRNLVARVVIVTNRADKKIF